MYFAYRHVHDDGGLIEWSTVGLDGPFLILLLRWGLLLLSRSHYARSENTITECYGNIMQSIKCVFIKEFKNGRDDDDGATRCVEGDLNK